MVSFRISVALMALLTVVSSKIFGQGANTGEIIINHAFTYEDEPYVKSDTSKVFYMIITDKSCSHCFDEMCTKVKTSKYYNYSVKAICIINHDLLKMLSHVSSSNEMIPCAKEVLFHFTDSNLLPNVYNEPSPQIIIQTNKMIKYYSYGETINFIDSLQN